MPDPKVPTVIHIHQVNDAVHYATATRDMTSDLEGDSDENTKLMRQDSEDKEVTVEDLKAMKQMIREIRENPDLLYQYSTTLSHHNSLPCTVANVSNT